MKISFRKLENNDKDFSLLYKWCQNKNVYEWFEQRILSFDEVKEKYLKKLNEKKQELLIIQCDNIDIGYTQVYKYEEEDNTYEFDIFIGEEEYLSKGIGTIVINELCRKIFNKADKIVLRPFKRNIRAVKCYLKCGFEIVDEYTDKDTLGNEETFLLMIKKH